MILRDSSFFTPKAFVIFALSTCVSAFYVVPSLAMDKSPDSEIPILSSDDSSKNEESNKPSQEDSESNIATDKESSLPPPRSQGDSSKETPDSSSDALSELELDKVIIQGQKSSTPLFQFNKLDKGIETIEVEQINNIRDLTRYDPGISVNEQGQGASSGYSIRGVDRNRVAIQVDGLAQGQVFSPASNYTTDGDFGGTINEIEYENVKQVSISKGASSVLAGNGALGGAVFLETKQADDVIKPGQNYGLDYKGAYISKNNQWVNRLAIAGRTGWLEGLVQYTHRTGHETQSHRNVSPQKLTFYYDSGSELTAGGTNLQKFTKEFSADNVWGPTREKANPMNYESKSWLIRSGLRPNSKHYFGVLFEDTRQSYQVLDMTKPLYYTYINFNLHAPAQYSWLQTWNQDNEHKKTRKGLEYLYTSNSDWLPNSVHLRLDRQMIQMDNLLKRRRCSKEISPDCWPSRSGQFARDTKTGTKETKDRLRLDADKAFTFLSANHQVRLSLGVAKAKFEHQDTTSTTRLSYRYSDCKNTGSYNNPQCPVELIPDYGSSSDDYSLEPILSQERFASINYQFMPNRYISIALGARLDSHHFKSDNRFVKERTYQTLSKQAGLLIKPSKSWELAYQISEGFRVPSIQQIYNVEVLYPGDLNNQIKPEDIHMPDIKPETALNHEFGIGYLTDAVLLRGSYFLADYKGLIDKYQIKGGTTKYKRVSYNNVQDAFVKGYNLSAEFNLHEISQTLPTGLNALFAYSRVLPRKLPKKLDPNNDNFINSSYLLDTIQPPRYVLALKYIATNQNWGMAAHIISSKEKDEKELKKLYIHPVSKQTVSTQKVPDTGKPWHTLDLSAWLSLGEHVIFRAGIYNALDARYSSWESLRQLGMDGISTTGTTKVAGAGAHRLTAPGRNFSATLEVKF